MHFCTSCEHCEPGNHLKKFYKYPLSTGLGVMMPRLGSANGRVKEVKFDSSFSGLRDYFGMGRLKSHLENIGSGTLPDVFFLFGGRVVNCCLCFVLLNCFY